MNILFNMMYHEVNELFEINQQQYFTDIKKKVGVHPSGFGAFKLTYTLNYSSDCYN